MKKISAINWQRSGRGRRCLRCRRKRSVCRGEPIRGSSSKLRLAFRVWKKRGGSAQTPMEMEPRIYYWLICLIIYLNESVIMIFDDSGAAVAEVQSLTSMLNLGMRAGAHRESQTGTRAGKRTGTQRHNSAGTQKNTSKSDARNSIVTKQFHSSTQKTEARRDKNLTDSHSNCVLGPASCAALKQWRHCLKPGFAQLCKEGNSYIIKGAPSL